MRILLIEDERPLAEWLCKAFEQSGDRVVWFSDGALASRALDDADYDVLVLDLGLPGKSGHEVLRQIRREDKRLPVLVLTARDSLAERVGTLNAGADDFLPKPFALPELEARLTALVRRSRGADHARFACGPLAYDAVTRQFTLHGERLSMPRRENALLRCLVQRSGEAVSRQQILDRVFSADDIVQGGAVDVLVHRLRRRLEASGVHISTYRGLGYVLEAEEGAAEPARQAADRAGAGHPDDRRG